MRGLSSKLVMAACLGCAVAAAGLATLSLKREVVFWDDIRQDTGRATGGRTEDAAVGLYLSRLSLTGGSLLYEQVSMPAEYEADATSDAESHWVVASWIRHVANCTSGNLVTEQWLVSAWPAVGLLGVYPLACLVSIAVRGLHNRRARHDPAHQYYFDAALMTTSSFAESARHRHSAGRWKKKPGRHVPPMFVHSTACPSCGSKFVAPFGASGSTPCPACGQAVEV